MPVVQVRMDEGLVARVDARVAGDPEGSRSSWVREAVRQRLERDELVRLSAGERGSMLEAMAAAVKAEAALSPEVEREVRRKRGRSPVPPAGPEKEAGEHQHVWVEQLGRKRCSECKTWKNP